MFYDEIKTRTALIFVEIVIILFLLVVLKYFNALFSGDTEALSTQSPLMDIVTAMLDPK